MILSVGIKYYVHVGATQWRRGRAGAIDRGLRERAMWAEPGSVTDSY